MPFECRERDGIEWFVCRGQRDGDISSRIENLQLAYDGGGHVWGQAEGCWEAVWLAARYNVRLLVLEDFDCRMRHPLRRRAQQMLYAVVCPVLLCGKSRFSAAFPNAEVYELSTAGDSLVLPTHLAQKIRTKCK